jgi:HEPN domain-containing protein
MLEKDKGLFTHAFFVNLSDMFAVEGRLLGKRIRIHSSDEYVLTIVIPSLVRKGDILDLCIPGALYKYRTNREEWGRLNRHPIIDKVFDEIDKVDAWISSVIVDCFGEKKDVAPSSSEIESMGNNLVHALQIINPDAVRMYSDNHYSNLCEVSTEVGLGDDGRIQPAFYITSSFDDREGQVTFADFKQAIRNVNKSVSVPYEMLDNARVNLSRRDTRSAVLHCATAIEVALKKLTVSYLDVTVTDNSLKEYILRQADGYSRLVDLCKRCSVSLEGLPNVKETVVDIRNRVIHGGYIPTRQEATKAYEDTRQALAVLKTPMFE